MAIKKISLIYEGEEALINAAIEVLAARANWKLLSEQEIEAGAIQETKEDAAKRNVTNYIRETVKQHNSQQAMLRAKAQSIQALDLITVKLETE